MERIDAIMSHKLFQTCQERIYQEEKQRIYCKHGLEHSLDVARIAYILNLEEDGGLDRELIYAMALLHDLGRSEEYETGISHHEAGGELAEKILSECGFTEEETGLISQAIRTHKKAEPGTGDYCSSLLYRADKLSRNCFSCEADQTCYWEMESRNHKISY